MSHQLDNQLSIKLEISWENCGERSHQIFVPKQRDPAQPGLNPFVFKQTFEWPLFVHREMWRGAAHQCLYKSTVQELVPTCFNPHCVGRRCLGECEGAQRDQGMKQAAFLLQIHEMDVWWW